MLIKLPNGYIMKCSEENHISVFWFRRLSNQLQLRTATVNPFYMRYTYLGVKSPSSFVTCAIHCIYPLSQEAPQTPMTKPPSQYMHYFNKIPPLWDTVGNNTVNSDNQVLLLNWVYVIRFLQWFFLCDHSLVFRRALCLPVSYCGAL